MENVALQDGRRIRSQILNKEPMVCICHLEKKKKKKSRYMRCAGFYYNRDKSPKESQRNGVS